MHAAQTQTILASALSPEVPQQLEQEWIEAGMREQRRSGLARALFLIRLLEQCDECTPDARLSFLVGAFLACDLDSLVKRGLLTSDTTVVITGGTVVATAWHRALLKISVNSTIIYARQIEQAILLGLKEVVECMSSAE